MRQLDAHGSKVIIGLLRFGWGNLTWFDRKHGFPGWFQMFLCGGHWSYYLGRDMACVEGALAARKRSFQWKQILCLVLQKPRFRMRKEFLSLPDDPILRSCNSLETPNRCLCGHRVLVDQVCSTITLLTWSIWVCFFWLVEGLKTRQTGSEKVKPITVLVGYSHSRNFTILNLLCTFLGLFPASSVFFPVPGPFPQGRVKRKTRIVRTIASNASALEHVVDLLWSNYRG